jgi:hypothetical protein
MGISPFFKERSQRHPAGLNSRSDCARPARERRRLPHYRRGHANPTGCCYIGCVVVCGLFQSRADTSSNSEFYGISGASATVERRRKATDYQTKRYKGRLEDGKLLAVQSKRHCSIL